MEEIITHDNGEFSFSQTESHTHTHTQHLSLCRMEKEQSIRDAGRSEREYTDMFHRARVNILYILCWMMSIESRAKAMNKTKP